MARGSSRGRGRILGRPAAEADGMDGHFALVVIAELGQAKVDGGGASALSVRDLRAVGGAGLGLFARGVVRHGVDEVHVCLEFGGDLERVDRELLVTLEAGMVGGQVVGKLRHDAFFLYRKLVRVKKNE